MVVTIDVLKCVKQCYSNQDGLVIQNMIKNAFDNGDSVIVSMRGITALNSSFVNTAFIDLLEYYDFDTIKQKLKIVHSTKQINNLIKNRFNYEVNVRNSVVNV